MNMRKIIAVLASVLMLCAAIPMGALSVTAADGDVVWSVDFNDGTAAFTPSEIVAEGPDGSNCMKWTASGGWSATYAVVKNMDPGTDYTITFKAKGSVAGGMGTTIQNGDWDPTAYWNGPSFNVTTEWQDFVLAIPANTYPFAAGTILFKWQDVGVAMDLYVDDIVISEGLPKLPLIENGDFEEGNIAPWTVHQQVTVEADAAYEGNYGAHLQDNGTWGGIMDTTLTVEAGKTYEISFWVKVNKRGINLQIRDGGASGANLTTSSTWYDVATHSEWTQKTYTVTPATNAIFLNFCGAGDGTPDAADETDTYVDSFTCIEIKDPSFDGYIYNGDFETGKMDFGTHEVNDTGAWVNLWGWTTVEQVEGHNGDYALKGTCNGWQQIYQPVAVTPNTDYTVVCYAKDVSNASLWIKNSAGQGDLTNTALNGGSDWALTTLTFNSGDNSVVWVGLMGTADGATYTVDDVTMFEAAEQSNDGYIVNGTFETGKTTPWDNLWGSCPKAEVVLGGKDDHFAVEIVSGEWKHVRQTDIAVEANTDYKISLWAKNTTAMNLLVKDNGDTTNLNNKAIEGGDEWTYNEFTFNTGDYTSVIVSLMGGAAEAYGTFDNIVMEKVAPACEHEYFYPCDPVCMKCYEITNPDAAHNVLHVEAVEATCTENGNIEYWYCEYCGSAWADEAQTQMTNLRNVVVPAAHTYTDDCDMDCDVCGEFRDAPHNLTTHVEAVVPANCQEQGCPEYWICEDCGGYFRDNGMGGYSETNPAWLYYTGEHVRPEGAIVCAVVACELCGEDTYGEPCDRGDAPVCQDAPCVNCGETVWGWGCNYNTGDEETPLPLCQAGTCVYCGTEYEYLYECESGAWAPCLDGECSYGCGKQFPATAAHVDEDANGSCDICWSEMPAVEIVYGDVNGDGEIALIDAILVQQFIAGYEVTLDETAADVNCDGEIALIDAILVQQFIAGYDVTLGPVA